MTNTQQTNEGGVRDDAAGPIAHTTQSLRVSPPYTEANAIVRSLMGRAAQISTPQAWGGPWSIEASYKGPIIAETRDYYIQRLGLNSAAIHEKWNMPPDMAVGKSVEIAYRPEQAATVRDLKPRLGIRIQDIVRDAVREIRAIAQYAVRGRPDPSHQRSLQRSFQATGDTLAPGSDQRGDAPAYAPAPETRSETAKVQVERFAPERQRAVDLLVADHRCIQDHDRPAQSPAVDARRTRMDEHLAATATFASVRRTVAALTDSGAYRGRIVGETEHHLLQQLSSRLTVVHRKEALQPLPSVGATVAVRYSGGKALVRDIAERVRPERGLSR